LQGTLVPISESPAPDAPLSSEEFQRLAQALDAHSGLDTDGLLGLLTAVASAPTRLPPSAWLPLVFPEDAFTDATREQATLLFSLVMRQYKEVEEALDQGSIVAPSAEEVDCCALFAEGFVLGAECDAAWRNDEEAWALVAPLAYLGGLREMVDEAALESFDADPESEAKICANLDRIVSAARRTLRPARALRPLSN
jgi:yecA family protein